MMSKPRNYDASSKLGYISSLAAIGIVVAGCLFIILCVFYYGAEVLSLEFLLREPNPSAIDTEAGGILTPLVGTIILTVMGIVVAFPFALATSIYLCFYSKRGILQATIKTSIDVLSGIPTVVVALFALSIFTMPVLSFLSTPVEEVEGVSRAYGKSFLVASIAMAIMILPFVIKAMLEAISSVPKSYIEGSLALGATKWTTISKVVLVAAKNGLITGVILGMGRIIGDTAIVWLTLGGSLRMTGEQPWYLPQNLLSTLKNTGSTLTTYIYYTSPAGEGNNYSVAFGASVVLIVIIIVLNGVTAVIGSMGSIKGGE